MINIIGYPGNIWEQDNSIGLFIHKNYSTHKIKVMINILGYPGNIWEQDNSIVWQETGNGIILAIYPPKLLNS